MAEGVGNAEAGSHEWETNHWQRLQELFYLAETAPASERTRILSEASNAPAVVDRVLALLLASEEPQQISEPPRNFANQRIGPYALLRHIGTGGLGSVYLAERMIGGAVLQCAVKVLSMHAAGPEFEARFQREQQVYSTLNHPNITRMLDAGLSDNGQPFLAMEFVDGVDIVSFCDERLLSIEQRLLVFQQICEAVAYAHQNLTVHLDLKPSNILVTKEGTVKLLDFGTSKILSRDDLSTTTVLATPAYASPEQLRHQPVTTASDVYGLGGVLSELLCGRRPWGYSSATKRLEDALQDREPLPLENGATDVAAEKRRERDAAALRDRLGGDLSSITAQCLRNRPVDRYRSVDALRDDLKRYLDGRPVLAHRQTLPYRLGKFLRRKKLPIALTTAAVFLIIGSLGYAGWRQHQALVQGERAENMQVFLYRLFRLANSNETGKPAATVPELLELGMRVLPQYISSPKDQRQAMLSLSESLYENGAVPAAHDAFVNVARLAADAGDHDAEAEAEAFAGMSAAQLGNQAEAETRTAHALGLSRDKNTRTEVRVWSQLYFGQVRENAGKSSDANLHLMREAVSEARAAQLPERETAFAMYSLASDLEERGELSEAETLIRDSLAIYNRDPNALCDQSQMYADLGYITGSRGDQAGSVPLFEKSLSGSRQCAGADSPKTLLIQDYTAGALLHAGNPHAAVLMMEDALPRWRKNVPPGPELANALYYTALAYRSDGQFSRAEPVAFEALGMVRKFFTPTNHMVGSAEQVVMETLVGERKFAAALQHAEAADSNLAQSAHSPAQVAAAQKVHAQLLALRTQVVSGK